MTKNFVCVCPNSWTHIFERMVLYAITYGAAEVVENISSFSSACKKIKAIVIPVTKSERNV